MVAIRDKVTKRQFTLAEIAFEICKALLDSFEVRHTKCSAAYMT